MSDGRWVRSAFALFILLCTFLTPFETHAQESQLTGQGTAVVPSRGSVTQSATQQVPRPRFQDAQVRPAADEAPAAGVSSADVAKTSAGFDIEQMLAPGGLTSTLKVMLLLTVLSLAPSILIMTTCFVRFVIVLGLLRQALGTQQMPPNQVVTSLCLFLTFLVMSPVWQQAYREGIRPYAEPQAGVAAPTLEETFYATARPVRRFMADQIELTGNSEAIYTFLDFQNPGSEAAPSVEPEFYDDLSLSVLLPAYMLSELKTAFVIGFQIFLPFLVIDMVVATVLMSMGMMMLPPVYVSLPLKLLLFVLIDGWTLTVGMLLESVVA